MTESLDPTAEQLALSVSWDGFYAIVKSMGTNQRSDAWHKRLVAEMTQEERGVANRFYQNGKHVRLVPSKEPKVPRLFVESE